MSCTVALTSMILSSTANADELTGCTQKRTEIENQLRYARKHNNTFEIAGLQTALDKNNSNCTDEGVLLKKQNKIAENQRKVAERERELTFARKNGDQKKIKQKEKKLTQAKADLTEAQSQLMQ